MGIGLVHALLLIVVMAFAPATSPHAAIGDDAEHGLAPAAPRVIACRDACGVGSPDPELEDDEPALAPVLATIAAAIVRVVPRPRAASIHCRWRAWVEARPRGPPTQAGTGSPNQA